MVLFTPTILLRRSFLRRSSLHQEKIWTSPIKTLFCPIQKIKKLKSDIYAVLVNVLSFSNPLKLLLCLYYTFSLSDCTLIYLSPSVSFISSKLNSNVIFPNCFLENVFIFSRVSLFLFLLLFVLFCFSKVLYNRNLELSHRWLSWGYTSNSSCMFQ